MEISTEKKTEIPKERTWKTLKGKKIEISIEI